MEYVNHLAAGGYAFIPGSYYQTLPDINCDNKDIFLSELEQLKLAYEKLTLDPYSAGNRWRGYAQCRRNEQGELSFGHFTEYKQTKNTIRTPAVLFAIILCCPKILLLTA